MKSKIIVNLIVFILLAFNLFLPSINALNDNAKDTSFWWIETVDEIGSSGRYTSIDLDSNEYPHITHCREDGEGQLKYVYWTGSTWKREIVDSGDTVLTSSIAIDTNDCPHLAYCKNSKLIYAYKNGSEWNKTEIYVDGVYGIVSLELDSNNYPHICFHDYYGSRNVRYAHWNGSAWLLETVDSNGLVGFHNSISIDSSDCPHIAYNDYTRRRVKYSYKDSPDSEWQREIIDTGGEYYFFYPTIDIDSNDCPHVGYYVDDDLFDLKYGYKDGISSEWHVETVISDERVGGTRSLALDSQDNPYFIYCNGTVGDLKYVRWNGTTWNKGTIDSEGSVGCCSEIVLDSNNRACISYRAYDYCDLKFARETIIPEPIKPLGPQRSIARNTNIYTTSANHPNGSNLYYLWDWGDGTNSGWIGPYPSGMKVSASHSWFKERTYEMRVKVRDGNDQESGWSEPLVVVVTNPLLYIP